MKLSIKIIISILVILALLFTAVYIFLVIKGKTIITAKLEEITQRKVTIKNLDLKPSFNLEIKGLDIQGQANIDYISISPSLLGLLTGSIALNEVKIIKPEITYERVLANVAEFRQENPLAGPIPKKKHPLRLILKRIIVKDGILHFIDRTVGADGIRITIKNLYFYLDNLMLLPRSVITNFQLNGEIPWQEGTQQGQIIASGWINLFKKDMQARIEIKDIDGVYLQPYYSQWVDLEKSRIQQAKLQFRSDITGHDNDVVADCHLELTDIMFRTAAVGKPEEKAYKIAAAVLDIFRALDKGKISLHFTIRTKMDRPEFGFDNIRLAFEDKLAKGAKSDKVNPQDLMMLPANLLQGAIKGATDVTKTLIESTVEVGKTIKGAVVDPIKGAVLDTFKKDKKEEKKVD